MFFSLTFYGRGLINKVETYFYTWLNKEESSCHTFSENEIAAMTVKLDDALPENGFPRISAVHPTGFRPLQATNRNRQKCSSC